MPVASSGLEHGWRFDSLTFLSSSRRQRFGRRAARLRSRADVLTAPLLHRRNVSFLTQAALDRARIAIGDSADEILGRPAFEFARERKEINLVVLTVAELGFGARGASLADIHARALRLGFGLCPEEVGPQLRLQYSNQPVGEFLHVAMKPQLTYRGEPVDLTLANSGAGLALLGGSARPDLVVARTVAFVFVRPSAHEARAR